VHREPLYTSLENAIGPEIRSSRSKVLWKDANLGFGTLARRPPRQTGAEAGSIGPRTLVFAPLDVWTKPGAEGNFGS